MKTPSPKTSIALIRSASAIGVSPIDCNTASEISELEKIAASLVSRPDSLQSALKNVVTFLKMQRDWLDSLYMATLDADDREQALSLRNRTDAFGVEILRLERLTRMTGGEA